MALPPQKPGFASRPGQKPAPQVGADLAKRAEAERQKGAHATDELAERCKELEEELEELKAKYEMYFLGVERLEPLRWREELKRNVARLKSAFTRNTGLRFRIQSLHARYLSYERLWLRAAREKEEGTYRRDVFKARLRSASHPPKPATTEGKRTDAEPEDVDLTDWRPAPSQAGSSVLAAPPVPPSLAKASAAAAVPSGGAAKPASAPPAKPAPSAAPPSAAGLTDPQMRSLYDAYIAAKKRCNEDVSRLTYDTVARSVSKQIPDILTRYNARAVDFKVVIKDGKAILKAVPKT